MEMVIREVIKVLIITLREQIVVNLYTKTKNIIFLY